RNGTFWLPRNLSIGSQPSSTLIATTSKLCGSKDSASRARLGISSRHGGHQVAQKFTSTGLPRKGARATRPPPRAGSLNPAAGDPSISPPAAALRARSSAPPKCWAALEMPTASTAISAKATNPSLIQRGTTQARFGSTGIPEYGLLTEGASASAPGGPPST